MVFLGFRLHPACRPSAACGLCCSKCRCELRPSWGPTQTLQAWHDHIGAGTVLGGDTPRLLGVPICTTGNLTPASEEPRVTSVSSCVPPGHRWEPCQLTGLERLSAVPVLLLLRRGLADLWEGSRPPLLGRPALTI